MGMGRGLMQQHGSLWSGESTARRQRFCEEHCPAARSWMS